MIKRAAARNPMGRGDAGHGQHAQSHLFRNPRLYPHEFCDQPLLLGGLSAGCDFRAGGIPFAAVSGLPAAGGPLRAGIPAGGPQGCGFYRRLRLRLAHHRRRHHRHSGAAPAGGLGGVCLLPGAGSGGLHGHRPGGLGGREGAGGGRKGCRGLVRRRPASRPHVPAAMRSAGL